MFTRVRLDNQLYNQFMFFADGGANGPLVESITGGDLNEVEHFYIKEVRLHLSVIFVSTEDFVIRLSDAAAGSAHNLIFISQAMSDVRGFQWLPDTADEKGHLLNSGDTLGFFLSMVSATNIWGLSVIGWAVAN